MTIIYTTLNAQGEIFGVYSAGFAPSSGWGFTGTGDFSGVETSDLLWRNGSTKASAAGAPTFLRRRL